MAESVCVFRCVLFVFGADLIVDAVLVELLPDLKMSFILVYMYLLHSPFSQPPSLSPSSALNNRATCHCQSLCAVLLPGTGCLLLHEVDNLVHCLNLCPLQGFPFTIYFQAYLCVGPNQQSIFSLHPHTGVMGWING